MTLISTMVLKQALDCSRIVHLLRDLNMPIGIGLLVLSTGDRVVRAAWKGSFAYAPNIHSFIPSPEVSSQWHQDSVTCIGYYRPRIRPCIIPAGAEVIAELSVGLLVL